MSQSNKSFPQRQKFWESPLGRKCLKSPETDSKAIKSKKGRRLRKKKKMFGKSHAASRNLNLRAKKKFWRRKKQATRRVRQAPRSPEQRPKDDWRVPTPHVLVQSQSARVQMLDYTSSIGDPQESWLWSSDEEAANGKGDGHSEFTHDEWASGQMVNFLDVTNITQSFDSFGRWGSIFESKKSLGRGELGEKRAEKGAASKRAKKTKKIQKKPATNKTKRKPAKKRKVKLKKNPKINDFYKLRRPVDFETVWLEQGAEKVSFRCYSENSPILKFAKEDLRSRLIEKDQDDDCATDDEIQQDSINYVLKHLKKSLRKHLKQSSQTRSHK